MKKIFYVLIIILLIFLLVYLYSYFKPVTSINYKGRTFSFRDDIKAANKIKVHPDEKTIHDMFWNPNLENITIIFKPLEKGSGYYMLESFELTYKLSAMYLLNGMKKNFDALQVNTYENINGSENVLKIVLVHPQLTNKTSVEGRNNLIFIHAKDYRDFDLATIKTILVAMGIYSR